MQGPGHGLGRVRAGLPDRLQILKHGGIGAGVDHIGHAARAIKETLAEGAAFIITIPIKPLGQRQALGGLRPEAMHFGQGKQQGREPLAALHDAEFGGLFDGVGGVQPGIGEANDLCARGLRLQKERRIIGGGQRMAHGALHGAAVSLDEIAGLFLQRIAEGIIRGQEEPAIAALTHQGAAGADCQRVGVIGPVEAIGRALFPGQRRGGSTGDDIDLLLLPGNALHGQRDRGGCQFHDAVHLILIVPLAGDIGGHIGLVLMIGGDHLDRLAEHGAAEILDRHQRGFIRPGPAKIGINAGLVIQNTDLDDLVGDLRLSRQGRGDRRHDRNGCDCNMLHYRNPS